MIPRTARLPGKWFPGQCIRPRSPRSPGCRAKSLARRRQALRSLFERCGVRLRQNQPDRATSCLRFEAEFVGHLLFERVDVGIDPVEVEVVLELRVQALGRVLDRVVEAGRAVVGIEPGPHRELERQHGLAGTRTPGDEYERRRLGGVANAAAENGIEAVEAGLEYVVRSHELIEQGGFGGSVVVRTI